MIEREAIPKMMVLLTWRGQITSKKKKKWWFYYQNSRGWVGEKENSRYHLLTDSSELLLCPTSALSTPTFLKLYASQHMTQRPRITLHLFPESGTPLNHLSYCFYLPPYPKVPNSADSTSPKEDLTGSCLFSFFFFFIFCFCFWDRVSLCSFGCPGTCYVDQAGLELTELNLPLHPKCWE